MKAVLDACVLYPTVMREITLGVAGAGLMKPVWSDRILEEWARAAARQGDAQEAVARGEIAIVRANWPDAGVLAAPETEAGLYLPDPNDVHVLASAIAADCTTIVTMNLKDFPRRLLTEHGMHAVHPDVFLLGVFNGAPDMVLEIAETVRGQAEQLSGHEWTLRALMKKARMPRLGKALETFS